MGTRSLTYVIEKSKNRLTGKVRTEKLVNMYRQYDGYPSGHGKELADFLKSGKLVNGLGDDRTTVFNGAGCLAARMVSHFKGDEAGGFYLYSPTDKSYESYTYLVIVDFDTLELKMECYEGSPRKSNLLFSGKPEDFENHFKQ